MAIDFTTIANYGNGAVQNASDNLQAQINLLNSKGNDVSSTDLLGLQSMLTKYTLTVDINSTMAKAFADSLKSIVSKAG